MRGRSWWAGSAAACALLVGLPAPAANVARAVLANGLRVVVVPSSLAPVVTIEVTYLAGGNESPPGFPGTAHAQEHMMFRGSPGLTAAQLSTVTAAMGGDFNADTQATVTQYYQTVPAEDLDVALHLEATRMRGVLDAPDQWDQERGAIEQEVAQDLSNPEYVLYTDVLRHLLTGTPYAVDPLGTRASFQKTTAAMLREFHARWYVPNNALLVIAGDVDPSAALARVRELFDGIPSRPVPPRPKGRLGPLSAVHLTGQTDLPLGLAVVAFRFPGYRSPDWAAAEILADVLDSRRGALYGLVPAGKALDVDFERITFPDAGVGLAIAQFAGDPGDLVEEMKAAIASYAKGGVPTELVEAAKRGEVTAAELRKSSISGLAAEWSRALAVEGRSSPEEDVTALGRVQPADASRVARASLVTDTALTAVLTPRGSGRPVAARSPRQRGESFGPRQVEPVAVPAWASKVLEPPSVPDLPLPADLRLPNGLRVLVRPEPGVAAVALYGMVKNDPDVETPPGQEGVDGLLEQLLPYGTATLDRVAFQRALDDLGASASLGTSFSLQSLPASFDRAVALVADALLHPALPAAAFHTLRRQAEQSLPSILSSPMFLAGRARERALYPRGDPRRREPSVDSVRRLSLDDVRRYHTLVFRPDLTTIVVLGRITVDEARTIVARHFGAWRASGPKPATDPPPAPPNPPSSAAVPDPSRVQVEVTLAQTLSLTRLDPDYYPLVIGDRVLAGGFYASRLFRDLRERTGLVYTVGAELDAGRTRSTYSIEYACDPGKVAEARAIAVRDLRQMQRTPVDPSELRRTQALLVRQLPLEEASFDSLAQGLLERSAEGLPIDEPRRAAERYLQTTAPAVRAAFEHWLRPDDLVQITVGPTPR